MIKLTLVDFVLSHRYPKQTLFSFRINVSNFFLIYQDLLYEYGMTYGLMAMITVSLGILLNGQSFFKLGIRNAVSY